jgi:Ran GTPase-activating protein (RanGAP) involved in mRNA processing and transport
MAKDAIISQIITITKDQKKQTILRDLLRKQEENYLSTHAGTIKEELQTFLTAEKQQSTFGRLGYYNVSTNVAEFILRQHQPEVSMADTQLSDKDVIAIAAILEKNREIRSLDLTNTGIGDKHIEVITNALSSNTTLQRLDFSRNNIQATMYQIELPQLPAGSSRRNLQHCAYYQNGQIKDTLATNGQVLSDDETETIANMLRQNPRLTSLDLRCKASEAQINIITDALNANKTLEVVSLDDKGLSTNGVIMIANALKGHATLEYVNFSNSTTDRQGGECFIGLLQHNTTLRIDIDREKSQQRIQYVNGKMEGTLSANGQALDDNDVAVIADMLRQSPYITSLDLRRCKVNDAQIMIIAEALKENTTLKNVYLDGSDISAKGVIAIADSLKNNTTLERLGLLNNHVDGQGAHSLMDVVQHNDRLYIDISRGKIRQNIRQVHAKAEHILSTNQQTLGDDDVAVIAGMLSQNSGITSLDLRHCKASDAQIRIIAKALKGNTTLKAVDWGDNEISAEGAECLMDALQHNTTLHQWSSGEGNHGKLRLLQEFINENHHPDVPAEEISNARTRKVQLHQEIEQYFTGSSINEVSTAALLKTIRECNLRTIALDNATLSDNAFEALMQVTKSTPNIVLSLRNVQMSEHSQGSLMKTLQTLPHSGQIIISDTTINEKTTKELLTIARTSRDVSIILHTENNTLRQAFKKTRFVYDTINDYAKSVVVPQLVERVNADPSISPTDKSHLLGKAGVITALNQAVATHLLKDLSNVEIKTLSDHWHQPLQQTKSNKVKDYGGAGWEPLLGQNEIAIPANVTGEEGWKLVARITPQALKEEGATLEHCVGGFAGRCITQDSHILSVVSPDGAPRSTIEIITDYKGNEGNGSWHVAQHYGKKNIAPALHSPEANTLDWLKEQIAKKELTINYQHLDAKRHERMQQGNELILEIGFPPGDKNKVDQIAQLYGGDMLPPKKGHEELRAKLKNNFQTLKNLPQIDLGDASIGGKSVFSALQSTVRTPQEKDTRVQLMNPEVAEKLEGERKYLEKEIQEKVIALCGVSTNIQVKVPRPEIGRDSLEKVIFIAKNYPAGSAGLMNWLKNIVGQENAQNIKSGNKGQLFVTMPAMTVMEKFTEAKPGLHVGNVFARQSQSGVMRARE